MGLGSDDLHNPPEPWRPYVQYLMDKIAAVRSKVHARQGQGGRTQGARDVAAWH